MNGGWRLGAALTACALTAAACTDAGVSAQRSGEVAVPGAGATTPADDESSTTRPTTSTTAPATTTPTSTAPATTTTSTTSSTTTSSTTTTTTPPAEPDPSNPNALGADPACVVEVAAGDSLSLIADRFDDDTITVPGLQAENDIGEAIDIGDLLDICVDNGLDDVTGEARAAEDAAAAAERALVRTQQIRLNELFAGLGTPELLVDGISGPVTRQRLCAARLALGLPVTTLDMVPGSDEERVLMEAEALGVPFTSAMLSPRWVLIDRTCQIMFAGEGNSRLVFAFPTSTGEPGYETRDQDRSPAFRYNPASGNGGWHNSTSYPVAADNPLNGNMYKPIYFDRGQAIHGASNVPTSPQSKGCARLRVQHQDALVAWLGLADVSSPTADSGRIGLTVNVQGTFVPPV